MHNSATLHPARLYPKFAFSRHENPACLHSSFSIHPCLIRSSSFRGTNAIRLRSSIPNLQSSIPNFLIRFSFRFLKTKSGPAGTPPPFCKPLPLFTNHQSPIKNPQFPTLPLVPLRSAERVPYLLCSLFSALYSPSINSLNFPPPRQKKDIMPLLRASACVDLISILRLPLLPPRPPLERTDGRTWLKPRLPKSAHFGSFFIKKY
jgi:hypothetical protein